MPLNYFSLIIEFLLLGYEIPAPDYDTTEDKPQQQATIVMESNGDIYEGEENHGSLSPEQIRSMMSKEQKELQRDLKVMQKRYVLVLLYAKWPRQFGKVRHLPIY